MQLRELPIVSKSMAEYVKWEKKQNGPGIWIYVFAVLLIISIVSLEAYSQVKIPGKDESNKLEMAGTLLKILDTALFVWGCRVFSGIALLGAAWNLKEQRIGLAVTGLLAALLLATIPTWITNLFNVSEGSKIFSLNDHTLERNLHLSKSPKKSLRLSFAGAGVVREKTRLS